MTGLLGRLRTRVPALDRVLDAQAAYTEREGDFYAAALTYFTLFAVFPLLMLGFAVTGFVLSRRPDLIEHIAGQIRSAVHGTAAQQLVDLVDTAVDSRTSVGLVGLGVAAWAGLSWVDKLREALNRMWGRPRDLEKSFVHTKLSDLLALLSVFVASTITLGLTALSSPTTVRTVLRWVGIRPVPGLETPVQLVSSGVALFVSLLVSWLLFTWMMARLPRQRVAFEYAMRAGWIVAIGFEVLKQLGAAYLKSVITGPAGVAFGPVLGLMVFVYITARLLLFATAWAAAADTADTSAETSAGPAEAQ